ncbi:MAG: hypothetical protein KJ709_00710 [Nanoarchaeota archaeon]|nr:hypothetical protein [Nanoarchaeota archaeon]
MPRHHDDRSIIQALSLLNKHIEKSGKILNVPISIFADRRLGMLESLTFYLHDKKKLSFHEIAAMLKRDDRTIWSSYHNAGRKKG